MEKKAIIIGAGPAGLTAAYELLTRTDIKPIILEKSGDIGGISKTVNYKGNRIDIGGHRFFSKSDRVMNWWLKMMPIQTDQEEPIHLTYHQQSHEINPSATAPIENSIVDPNNRMLVRKRLSRIYFLRKFFSYPIQLSLDTLAKLGLWTTMAIILSYLCSQIFPRKREQNLEDFMINRFGKVLYKLFFQDYTEKVWGIPCNKISAEWGAQRIKGVSISKAIRHALQSATKKSNNTDIRQKSTETSLIEQFLYPMYGPGQMWVEVARQIESLGGKILMHHNVNRIYRSDNNGNITAVATINDITGETSYLEGDYFFSTMPVQELIGGLDGPIPDDVREVATGLQYRDFITVGILLKKLSFPDKKTGEWKPLELKDTWIYIQDKDVKVGRLQIFNNWSPYMAKDPDTIWIGMEFFCATTDNFWNNTDEAIKELAIHELEKVGLASKENILDSTVLRMEKTYPAYFGTYERFDRIKHYVNSIENLFLVGRNGMHKYNNSDHSMLTAMVAVDNISLGVKDKTNIWEINTEQAYHEQKNQTSTATSTKKTKLGNPDVSFAQYIFGTRDATISITIILLIAQFIGFKYLFPYANFMPDTYSYLDAAMRNSDINIWPIGYSKFLRVFSTLLHNDTSLVFAQYIFLELTVLYLLYSIFYIFKIDHRTKVLALLSLILLNPILVNISNYVSADAIFTGLSIVWTVQLLWLLYSPKPFNVWLLLITLILAFTFRYNALYYPLISAIIILTAKIKTKLKIKAVALGFAIIGMFVWHNGNKYKELTGQRQFAAFGGWQLASNALFMYRYVTNPTEHIPIKFQNLHAITRVHMDSLKTLKVRPDSTLGIYYLWDEKAPLMRYMTETRRNDTSSSYFKKWATLANEYYVYGKTLIQNYPKEYAKYYLLPNLQNYIVPPPEFLSIYNMKEDSVKQLAKNWFGYKKHKVTSYKKETRIFNVYSVLFALSNVLFLCSVVGFVWQRGITKLRGIYGSTLILITIIWLLNLSFSVAASPIVMRYQIYPMVILLSFGTLIIGSVLNYKPAENAKI